MKLKKMIVSIFIMLITISVNTQCQAKYVFEHVFKAAEIIIKNN